MIRRFATAVATVVLVMSLVGCAADDDLERASSPVADDVTTTTTAPVATSPPPTPPPTTAPPPPPPPPAPGIRVADVVDGDTIVLVDGAKIRMIGIDTPERGECGYREATNALTRFISGRPVTLVPGARDDTDRYGRLLRYVEVDGVDVNLAMISAGWARSRYDSRDGYGRHAREDAYVAADATSSSPIGCTVSAPAPASTAAPATPGGDDPRFGSCARADDAGYGPYRIGVDPEYGWYDDGDGDGVVCE